MTVLDSTVAQPAPAAVQQKKPRAKKDVQTAAKPPAHPKYEDMVKAAILTLKDRKGSSRQAIKKFIAANYRDLGTSQDLQINNAIKRGVEKGIFAHPKGHSGSVKLVKPEKSTEKKPKAAKKKADGEGKETAKKASGAAAKAAKAKSKAAEPKAKGEKAAVKTGKVTKKTASAKKAAAPKAKTATAKTGAAKKAPVAKKAKVSKKAEPVSA